MKKKFWKDRKVFVTGSTGLLGYWLIQYLLKYEADIIVLVRNEASFKKRFAGIAIENITIVTGEIINAKLIQSTLKKYEIDTVFHLAAQTITPVSFANPTETFETNIQGAWTVLEACRQTSSIKRILLASSDKAYGDYERRPYTEKTKLYGIHPYNVSKSCADLIAQSYAASYGLPIGITRCGNLFGGGDLTKRLVPTIMRSALLGEDLVLRSSGKFTRDFFYVEDAVIATMTLVEELERPEIIGQAFNFSDEHPITIIDLVNKILKRANSTVKPTILNQPLKEVKDQYLSSKKAHELLEWKPQFTMNEGIDRTIQWYKKYFKKHT